MFQPSAEVAQGKKEPLVKKASWLWIFKRWQKVNVQLSLSTTPWRHIGEWRYRSRHSWPQH